MGVSHLQMIGYEEKEYGLYYRNTPGGSIPSTPVSEYTSFMMMYNSLKVRGL